MLARSGGYHLQRGLALRCPGGQGQTRVDHQSVPVLHQNVPQIAKPGGLAWPLAVQSGIGIGGRGVRLIAALLAVKVLLAIAAGRRRRAAAVLGANALDAGPGFDHSVPSTEKWSSDNSALTEPWLSTAAMNFVAMSPSIRRSRFLVNTVASHISASSDSPTNQRNSRL